MKICLKDGRLRISKTSSKRKKRKVTGRFHENFQAKRARISKSSSRAVGTALATGPDSDFEKDTDQLMHERDEEEGPTAQEGEPGRPTGDARFATPWVVEGESHLKGRILSRYHQDL